MNRSPAKILFINAKPSEGGAAKAALRLYRALAGEASFDLAWMSERANPLVDQSLAPQPGESLRQRWSRDLLRMQRKVLKRLLVPSGGAAAEGFDFGAGFAQAAVREVIPPCDLVNLHWVSGLIDPSTVAWIAANRAPVVWTLHDMAPMTGGCHYDGGCSRFADECRRCPLLRQVPAFDYAARSHGRKRALLGHIPRHRLHIVAPSRWLAREAERSTVFRGHPVHVIPNAVDIDTFSPRPKAVARRRLDLPGDRPIILFAADNLASRRKGGHLLGPLIERIQDAIPDIFLVSVGSGAPDGPVKGKIASLGYIDNDDLLADIYSAADLTLLPSLQDNLPNTMLESMACGVPVAGFDIGGIPDLVIDGRTGFLAACGDLDNLSARIATFLKRGDLRADHSRICRQTVEQACSPRRQAERYSMLYRQVMDSGCGR